MLGLLFFWGLLLAALIAFGVGQPGRGGALTLAYFLGLSLIHLPGLLPFIGGEPVLSDRLVTRVGFETTLLGMAAFIAGALLARRNTRGALRSATYSPRGKAFEYVGWRAFALGAFAYFVLIPLSFRVPSATAVVSAFATLLTLGLWLVVYGAVETGDQRRVFATLGVLPLLSLYMLAVGGYLGVGIYLSMSVIAFLFAIVRSRAWFYLAAPFVIYLGLSLFVTYMGQRGAIREVVWHEHGGLLSRLSRASRLVTDFRLLDLDSPTQDAALDGRLNQNALVGTGVLMHEGGWSHFAYGATVPLWALIPRAVWPGKPAVGGGLDVVSKFTGIRFAPNTSVGAGQVLEFYVNFGIPGVLIGFLGLGFLLMRLDRGIMRALAAGDMRALLLRAMPGLTLLQPGGNLLEILVAFVGAVVAAHLVLKLPFFELGSGMRASIPSSGLRGSGAEPSR